MAAARKRKKLPEVRGRKWTENVLKQFAIVLTDEKNGHVTGHHGVRTCQVELRDERNLS